MANVTLKVQVGNVAVEVTGEPSYCETKLSELLEKYTGYKASENRSSGSISNPVQSAKSGKTLSHSEFLKKAAPKTQIDRALVLAYYLEKYAAAESFTSAELIAACKAAKQQAFTNASDCVGKLVSQGFLMGAGDKDGGRAYSLTTSGEDQVESMLTNQG